MKKRTTSRILSVLLAVVLAMALGTGALAADSGIQLCYDLSVGGKNEVTARTGEVINVTFTLKRTDAAEEYGLSAMQNEIMYDQDMFEYVQDSAKVLVGGSDFVGFQTRGDGVTHIVKAAAMRPSKELARTTAAEEAFCTFQLKVIGKSGSGRVRSDRAKAYDGENQQITITEQALTVTVRSSGSNGGSDTVKPAYDSCKKDESCPVYPFVDSNPKAWYHDGVHYCLDEGLMNGIGDKQFAPDLTTSRAMIVTILYRLEGKPATTVTDKYDDVPAGQWYSEAVSWADANGVVKGFGDGTFRPDDDITREQMATIFQRYAALKNKADGKKADLSGYTDAAEVSLWALEGMQWANGAGLIQGRTATTLAPGATATRAEAATILLRFCTGI